MIQEINLAIFLEVDYTILENQRMLKQEQYTFFYLWDLLANILVSLLVVWTFV